MATTTTKAGITRLRTAQANAEATANEGFDKLDCFATRLTVKNRTTAAPPGSPVEGDLYLVATGPSGDWTGHAGHIAAYLSGWKFFVPKEGLELYVEDEDLTIEYDGTDWLLSGSSDLARTVQLVKTDFPNLYFGTPFNNAQNGAGAGHTIPAPTADRPGGVSLDTGTTTTGVAAAYLPTTIAAAGNGCVLFGGGKWTMEWVVEIATLSTVGEEYTFRCGFRDATEATSTDACVDGAYFEYDRLSSVNWRMVTASNSTRTKTNTSTAVATGKTKLKIVVNAAGTSVDFYVNDTLVGTVATNVPSGAGRDTGVVAIINKSAGTTSRSVILDACDARCRLTNKR